jgi:hypothetical protein
MLSPLLALLLALPLQDKPAAPAEPPPPDAAQVKEAVTGLELARKSKDPALMLAALEGAQAVPAPQVAEAAAELLDEKERDVRVAATECLRHLAHDKARDLLERHVKRREKALADDPELHGLLLRAVAQHASEHSLALLTDNPWGSPDHRVIRARLLGLGNIRHDKALKAVMDLTNQAGKNKVEPYMDDVRCALAVLSGEDKGPSLDAWRTWWNDEGKDSHVAPAMPKALPREVEQRWKGFWNAKVPGFDAPPEPKGGPGGGGR